MSRYEIQLFDYFDTMLRLMKAQPLNLGGIAAPSGGQGGGGGYIGYLPQTRVSYDETEAETMYTPPISGSLLDNLNHIRYRVNTLETTLSGGIAIYENSIPVASGVTVVDFLTDFEVEDVGSGHVTVTLISGAGNAVTLSGVWNEDLTGHSGTHFDTSGQFAPDHLRVFHQENRKSPTTFTEDADHSGFTTTFTVVSGDQLVVDYDVYVSGYPDNHFHPEYVTLIYLLSNYMTSATIVDYLNDKSDVGHTHLEADITDLVHDADFLKGIPVSGITPMDGQILTYTSVGGGAWKPSTVSGVLNTVHQQVIFSYEGEITSIGTKPLRLYVHDVGAGATLEEIFVSLNTAPLSTPVRIDVLKNGVTVLDVIDYIQINAGSYTASRTTNFVTTDISKDDYFQYEVVQGDYAASDLTVHIRFRWEI